MITLLILALLLFLLGLGTAAKFLLWVALIVLVAGLLFGWRARI